MVDPDVLRRKVAQVQHHCARLERVQQDALARLQGDESTRNDLLMDLQQAIQGCIDLGAHVCVDDRLGAPGGAAEAFVLLRDAGRIDAALTTRLVGAAGLRNLIVHRYHDLDLEQVAFAIATGLDGLRAFVAEMQDPA